MENQIYSGVGSTKGAKGSKPTAGHHHPVTISNSLSIVDFLTTEKEVISPEEHFLLQEECFVLSEEYVALEGEYVIWKEDYTPRRSKKTVKATAGSFSEDALFVFAEEDNPNKAENFTA